MKRELLAKATFPNIPLGPEDRLVAIKKLVTIGMEEIQNTIAVVDTAAIPCHRTLPPVLLDTFLTLNRWHNIATVANTTANVGIMDENT